MEKDMKDVLHRLSEINSASERIMRNTNHEKVAYADYIKQKTADFDTQIQKQVADEVEQVRVKIIAENSAVLEENRRELETSLKALDEGYKAHRDKWIQDIFESIITD